MNKTFDCVEMKHNAAEKIQEKLTGMSSEEQLEYWQERTEVLRKRIEAAKAKLVKTDEVVV